MQTIEMRLGYLKTQGLIKTPSQENFMRNVLDKFKGDDAKLKQVLTDLSVGTPEERATAVKTIQQTMMSGGRDGYSALYDTKIGQALKDIAIAFDVAYQKEVQHIPAAELTNPLAINQGTLSHESEGFVPSGVQLAQSNAKRAASKAANLAFEVELKKFSDPKDRLALVKAAAKSGVDIDYAVIHEHDPNARETLSKANTKLAEFATQRFNAIKEEEAKKDQSGDFRARYRDLETLVKAEIRKIKDVTSQQEDLLMQTIEASRGADGTLDPELLKTNLDTVSKTGQAPAKHQAGEARAGNDTLVGGADQSVKGTATAANDIVRDLSAGIPP